MRLKSGQKSKILKEVFYAHKCNSVDELKDTVVMAFESLGADLCRKIADQSPNAAKNVNHLKMGVVTLKIFSLCFSGNKSGCSEPNAISLGRHLSLCYFNAHYKFRIDRTTLPLMAEKTKPSIIRGSPCM